MDLFCSIEISKDGIYFVARIRLATGVVNEYRHKKFEDLLTELVIALQEEVGE